MVPIEPLMDSWKDSMTAPDDEKSSPITITEAVGIVGSVIGAFSFLIFYLNYQLYSAFYERLGIRPEDVGIDRPTILLRSSAFTLGTFCVLGVILAVVYSLTLAVRGSGEAWKASWSVAALLLPVIIIAAVFLAPTYLQSRRTASLSGRLVASGAGIGTDVLPGWSSLLVDIRVPRASIVWLEDPDNKVPLLDDPDLLYLGRSSDFFYFVACGQTIQMPTDNVAVSFQRLKSMQEARQSASNIDRLRFCDEQDSPVRAP